MSNPTTRDTAACAVCHDGTPEPGDSRCADCISLGDELNQGVPDDYA